MRAVECTGVTRCLCLLRFLRLESDPRSFKSASRRAHLSHANLSLSFTILPPPSSSTEVVLSNNPTPNFTSQRPGCRWEFTV